MAFATCRGCGRTFTKDGWGAQSASSPRLCKDCEGREAVPAAPKKRAKTSKRKAA